MAQGKGIPGFVVKGIPVFIGADPSDIASYVILCVRDPLCFSKDPVSTILDHLSCSRKVGDTHMFITLSGEYKGVPVTVCVTGSGAPETELVLAQFIEGYPQVNTVVRLGACGGFQPDIKPGTLAIASGAVRDEGSSKEYVSPSYPAIANYYNYEVLLAQIEAAEKLGVQYSVGVFRSDDTMYPGLGRALKGYIQKEHEHIVEYWSKANVFFIDRETSLVLTLTTLFGLRGGSVCVVVDNYFTGELVPAKALDNVVKNLLLTILESFVILNKWDTAKKSEKWLTPSIIKEAR